jgi:hypothetical protein
MRFFRLVLVFVPGPPGRRLSARRYPGRHLGQHARAGRAAGDLRDRVVVRREWR